jgi:hypothetical protein
VEIEKVGSQRRMVGRDSGCTWMVKVGCCSVICVHHGQWWWWWMGGDDFRLLWRRSCRKPWVLGSWERRGGGGGGGGGGGQGVEKQRRPGYGADTEDLTKCCRVRLSPTIGVEGKSIFAEYDPLTRVATAEGASVLGICICREGANGLGLAARGLAEGGRLKVKKVGGGGGGGRGSGLECGREWRVSNCQHYRPILLRCSRRPLDGM